MQLSVKRSRTASFPWWDLIGNCVAGESRQLQIRVRNEGLVHGVDSSTSCAWEHGRTKLLFPAKERVASVYDDLQIGLQCTAATFLEFYQDVK